MFGSIGPWELILILLVALIVVGPGKLPDVAKAIGKGINEFKRATSGVQKEFQEAINTEIKTTKPSSVSSPTVNKSSDDDNLAEILNKKDITPLENNSPEPEEADRESNSADELQQNKDTVKE